MLIKFKNDHGFTIVEIMVVLALVALTSAIAIVNILSSRRTVEYNLCVNNRAVLEQAEISYYAYKKSHTESFDDLVTSGYLGKVPACPSQGVYAWVPYDADDPDYQTEVGCSFHAPETAGAGGGVINDQNSADKKTKKKKK